MSKAILGTLLILTGVAGLFATGCGLLFLLFFPQGDFWLLGVVPGVLILLVAAAIWKALESRRGT